MIKENIASTYSTPWKIGNAYEWTFVKAFVAICMLSLSIVPTNAQTKGNALISVSTSVSSPIGVYRDFSYNGAYYSGLPSPNASTGINLGIDYVAFLNEYVSIGGKVLYNRNNFDSFLQAGYVLDNHGPSRYYQLTPISTEVRSDAHQQFLFLVQPRISVPMKKFAFDVWGGFGSGWYSTAYINTVTRFDDPYNQFEEIQIDGGSGFGIAWDFGLGLRWNFSKRVGASINASLTGVDVSNDVDFYWKEQDDLAVYEQYFGTYTWEHFAGWISTGVSINFLLGSTD